MNEILIAARFVHFASMVLLFGGALFILYGAVAHVTPEAPPMMRLRRLWQAGSVLALLSALAWFAVSIANMTGDWMDVFDMATVSDAISEPGFGLLWVQRTPLLVILAVLSFVPAIAANRRGRLVFAALSGVALASLALTGHAELPKGLVGIFHRLTDAIHLLSAGAWLGGLAGLAIMIALAKRNPTEAAVAHVRTVVPRFSQMGYWAVGLILVTGIINGAFLVGSVGALFFHPYGRLVLLKIVLALGMVGLAWVNRFRIMPQLLTEPGPAPAALGPLARNVALEQVLAAAILGAVAYLGTMIPAVFSE